MADYKTYIKQHLLIKNPLLRLGVGIAPALGATATLAGGVVYSLALLLILPGVTAAWTPLCRRIPKGLSLPLYMLLCALLTAAVQYAAGLLAPQDSLTVALWIPLTALSALLMGPVRTAAQSLPVGPAVLDATGCAGAAAAVCVPLGFVRELLATGRIFGWPECGLLPAIGVFALPAGGLLLFAVCAWLVGYLSKKEEDRHA